LPRHPWFAIVFDFYILNLGYHARQIRTKHTNKQDLQVYQIVIFNNFFSHLFASHSAVSPRAIKYQKYDLWFGQGFDVFL